MFYLRAIYLYFDVRLSGTNRIGFSSCMNNKLSICFELVSLAHVWTYTFRSIAIDLTFSSLDLVVYRLSLKLKMVVMTIIFDSCSNEESKTTTNSSADEGYIYFNDFDKRKRVNWYLWIVHIVICDEWTKTLK